MTSVLNVDTIADKAGTGPVALTKQSAAKAWCAFNTVTNHSTFDSFNTSALTDNGSGDTTISYTSSMAAAKSYSVTGVMADASDVTNFVYSSQPKQDDSVATGSVRVVHVYAGATSSGVGDTAYVCNVIHGDLA
jgi:hypothetical protein